jgi:vacuolar-type H+-ATPase subunit I/STV1
LEEELEEKIRLIHAEEVPILKKYLTPEGINFSRIEGEINIISSTLSKYKTERENLKDSNIYKFAAINEVVQDIEEYHWAERQFKRVSPKTLLFEFYVPSWQKEKVKQKLLEIFKNRIIIDVIDIPRFQEIKETENLEPKSEKIGVLANSKGKNDINREVLEEKIDKEDIRAETPTIMKNPWFIKPFELITKMYGVPSYSEIDPTPFLAFTFPFIFGLMFGDIGHGLILIISGILGGIIFRKKSIGRFSWIIFYCGIGAALGGFFYGEFFGNENFFGIPLRPILLYIPFLGPINIYDPLQNIQNVFMFALFIGVVHINLGWSLEFINYVRQSKKYLAITNSLIKIILLTGGTFLIFHYGIDLRRWLSFPYPILLVIVPGILLIVLKPLGKIFRISYLKKESYGSLMGEGTVETFETALSILSNVASYIRLLALALAHIALMISIQALTGLIQGEGLLFDILRITGLIFGNLLVILLEGILVFINTIRLHFYEFFFKFYKGSGTEFFPFYLDNNYSKIIFKVALEKDIISEEIQKEIESEQAKLEIDKAVKYFEDNYLDHK